MLKFQYVLYLFFGLAFYSCDSESKEKSRQKSIVEVQNNSYTSFNLQQSFNAQTFEISTDKKQSIIGEQGTKITIPRNCFGGEQGIVKIELIECYSIQDMLFNNLSTQTSDDRCLESDGMIYLNAINENYDTLKIREGKLRIQIPTEQRKNEIQIFEGIEHKSSIVWKLANVELENNNELSDKKYIVEPEISSNPIKESVAVAPIIKDTSQTLQHHNNTTSIQPKIILDKEVKNESIANYVFNISKMGWVNCDRFIEGETQDLFVNVSEEQQNVSLYLVLDKINSNVLPRNLKAVNEQFEFTNIPLNESFTLVALATKGDEIHLGMASYSSNDGTIDCPELKPVTRQELTDILLEKFGKSIWERPLA